MNGKQNEFPLKDIRVLDLSWVWSGPMVGYIMADFGAEVIKVEHSERLDNVRLRGRPSIGNKEVEGPEIELGPYFHNLNRNKLSITLNLKTREGSRLFVDLVKKSDVLIENFTPKTLAGLGLDYDQLKNVKPQLIMLSLFGMGSSGPLSNLRAYAPIISSLAGFENLAGYEGQPPIGRMNFGLSDPNAGVQGFFAVMVGLYHREQTGEGTHIEMSQLEAALCLLGEAILEYEMNGTILGSLGNKDRKHAPQGIYPCKGKDKWVALSVESDQEWEKLKGIIEDSSLTLTTEKSFKTMEDRHRNQETLDQEIKKWTLELTREEAVQRLREGGVAVSPVLSIEEAYEDEHYRVRGIHKRVTHPLYGEEVLSTVPWHFNKMKGEISRSAPILGEHNEYVFSDILGLSSQKIKELKNRKVIY